MICHEVTQAIEIFDVFFKNKTISAITVCENKNIHKKNA